MKHKPLKLRLIPTERKLWIYVGNKSKVQEEFKKADVDGYGCYFADENTKGEVIAVIYLSEWCLQTLVHETTHAIDFFSESLEIESKELRAYYMDYVFMKAYKHFNPKEK